MPDETVVTHPPPPPSTVDRPAALAPAEAVDQPLQRAIDQLAAKGKPGRLALAVEVYDGRRYHRLPGVAWRVNVTSVAQARRLLELVDAAFAAFEREDRNISMGGHNG